MQDFLTFLKGKRTYSLAGTMVICAAYLLFSDKIETALGVVGIAGLATTLRMAITQLEKNVLATLAAMIAEQNKENEQ